EWGRPSPRRIRSSARLEPAGRRAHRCGVNTPPAGPMRVAVVGHVEWIHFGRVATIPSPGDIVHATEAWEEPGGGGAIAAVQLVKLAGTCDLFTAFGDDA